MAVPVLALLLGAGPARIAVLAGLLLAVATARARAEVPAGVSRAPGADGASATARAPEPTLDPNRYETSLLPLISADTDRGFGFGALAVLAKFDERYDPFRWRMQLVAFQTVRGTGDDVELPFQKYRLKLDLPGLMRGRMRLNLDVGFSRCSSNSYHGLGNASPDGGESDDFYQYRRTYPGIRLRSRLRIFGNHHLFAGGSFTYNWITLRTDSKLAHDLEAGPEAVTERLNSTEQHAVLQMIMGWIWDTRDHDYAPSRGMFHEVSYRISPAVGREAGEGFGGINLTARAYHSLIGHKLVLAWRVMADLLMGEPPLYELVRYGGLDPGTAPGGDAAVRGVPRDRYYGKIKLLANLELRSMLLPVQVWGQRFRLGAVAFFDAGRVWTDYDHLPGLDGTGPGIKYGAGGGLRIQWGETLIVRVDTAWSPDADPVGVYLNVNHVF